MFSAANRVVVPLRLIVVGDGGAAAGLERQAGLGSIQGLDLRLLVDRQHHGMGRWVHVEADNVFDLLGEGGVTGAFESTPAVRLQVAGLPDTLDRTQADADGLSHGPAGPMGGLAGRFLLTGHGDHSSDRLRRQRRPSRRPGLVAQQAVDAFLGKPALPTPHRRPTHAGQTRHLCHRQALGRRQDDPDPLYVLERARTIADDRRQTRTVLGANDDVELLCHHTRMTQKLYFCESFVCVNALAVNYEATRGPCF